jgi:hypothetical protein
MSRLIKAIGLGTMGIMVFYAVNAYAGQVLGVPLGVRLGSPLGGVLGTSLPFAGGGILAVAAAAVVGGIFIKRRKR